MFKITIKQIDKSREEEIIVNCHEIDDEVVSIVNMLRKSENVLLASKDNKTFRISIKDIFYIESVDNKTLSGTKLFRCSKSMILNIAKIRSVSPSVNGRFEARLTNNENVIISRQYVPNLKKRLGM